MTRLVLPRLWPALEPKVRQLSILARQLREARALAATGLFDRTYYCARYPDVRRSRVSPLFHYVRWGAREGRWPNPNFDTAAYFLAHPELAMSGENPLHHFALRGSGLASPASTSDAPPAASPQVASTPLAAPEPGSAPPRVVAFYLPQYHPIPENDLWWGAGFTDWRNVARAQPLHSSHHQPRRPGELGAYDLRDPGVRARQAELARAHGIAAFCYYFYWFAGRRLLEQPLEAVLASGEPRFPFCVCWANENWTRRWDGLDSEVLMAQTHTLHSDYAFIEEVLPILQDPRYLRTADGKPVLVVYRADLLSNPVELTAAWRDAAERAGLPGLHLCSVEFHAMNPLPLGFDAAIEFPPHHFRAPLLPIVPGATGGTYFDYPSGAQATLARPRPAYPLHRGVMPAWDNTPRRGRSATVFVGASPAVYREWLSGALHSSPPGGFVFVNAWNEWAEGATLEPDGDGGRANLEVTRAAISAARSDREPLLLVGHDAARAGSQLALLELVRALARSRSFSPYVLLLGGGELEAEYRAAAPTVIGDLGLVDRLIAGGLRRAVCNTVVTAPTMTMLSARGLRILAQLHEFPGSIDRDFGGPGAVDRVSAAARIITAPSAATRDALVSVYGLDPAQVRVAYPPLRSDFTVLDRASARATLGWSADAPVVLGCGTVYPRTGPDIFVEVAARVHARDPRCRFVWVGAPFSPSDGAQLAAAVHDAGLVGVVELAGGKRDVSAYFAGADLFLLTSREDPFPLVVLEAMAASLPVVALSAPGGVGEALRGDAGVLRPDPAALAEAVLELLANRQRARELGARGKERVRSAHAPASYLEQVLPLLDEVDQ